MTDEEIRKLQTLIADVLEHDRNVHTLGCPGAQIIESAAALRTAAPQLATALRDALDREQAMQEALDEQQYTARQDVDDGQPAVVGRIRATYARKLQERRRDR